MLTITIPKRKMWDDENQIFIYTQEAKLVLEHSLVSISKWEAKWHKPFLSDTKKTQKQSIDYVRCMTITQNVDETVYNALTTDNLNEVTAYIDDKMTATWFADPKNGQNKPPIKKEVITSELIYYWMIALEIPFECQRWHLNRLLTLIKICNIKGKSTNKKQSKKEIMSNNAALNAARRKQLNTSG